MKKTLLIVSLLFASQSSFAVCTTNNWIDPSFSPSVMKALKKEMKKKGYREQTARDDNMEDNRFIASYYSMPNRGESFIRFYIQEFRAPNFVEIDRVEVRVESSEKDAALIELFDRIPQCLKE